MNGYRYAIYERALAEALHATGQLNAAIAKAALAKQERDSGNLRLDLERERALAHRLEIELVQESGDLARAGELIDAYVQRWGKAELGDVADRPHGPAADLVDSGN
jgi:prophage DNA circulation protein